MARAATLLVALLLALIAAVLPMDPAGAARISDVRGTRHNLSAAGPGSVKAPTGGESQICIFCHTPHGAESIPNAPLWNRKLSAATYTTYTSSSIEASAAELAAGPGGSSKLCLSCHDGTMAISSVNVLNGQASTTIPLSGTATGGMMPTTGATTGFTRNLGVNLSNDHPISFTYNATLAGNDGELRSPDGTLVGTRSPGVKPTLPLQDGQVQCTTCHDPHLRETDTAKGPAKFLRLNRFQELAPTGGAFSATNDIICLACHDKGGQLWALSAHAHPTVANELYTTDAANRREFPTTAPGMPVWKAACLNCHDTHTVQGARRLLREGTDSTASPKAGGGSAIEETCYQCHAGLTDTLASVSAVPNIKDEFARTYRMPIKTGDQSFNGNNVERHDIGAGSGTGKDFVESQALLANRHVECTDCHNPHRVTRMQRFNADPTTPDASGTHRHAAGHANIASGVLRGMSGVEPTKWAGVPFGNRASEFAVKSGDGGNSTDANPAASSAWLTREYQVCLKCHSSHAYGNTPPDLGSSGGGTLSGTNDVTRYTDQAMEFQAPTGHRGRPASTGDSGAAAGWSTNNHRSWHPVIGSTGRTHTLRGTSTSSWRAPWNADADVGSQTMYCSDCHGANTAADSVVGSPAGPHGSGNAFILKGEWSSSTGTGSRDGGQTSNALCFKCHNPGTYLNGVSGGGSTGFNGGGKGNLHKYHNDKIERLRCTWCHVAVPHGWKNRSLLVNLNDVGPEVTCRQQDADDLPTGSKCTVGQPMPAGTQMRNGPSGSGATSTTDWNNRGYTNGPYYLNAMLKIRSFPSGSWSEGNCGSSGSPGNGSSGRSWMRDSNESCETAP